MIRKICLYGPTGSGKTTIAKHLVKKYDAELFKIADPLYQMQNILYEMIGKDISGQDGELLQFLGYKIEKEQPGWLAKQFIQRIQNSRKLLIVNDDCRFNSYAALKLNGFIFIRIYTNTDKIAERLRKDHTVINPNHPVEQGFENFQPDYIIDNNDLIEYTLLKAYEILDSLLN